MTKKEDDIAKEFAVTKKTPGSIMNFYAGITFKIA